MADRNLISMFLGIGIGVAVAMGIIYVVAIPSFVLGVFYRLWHDGRDLAQLVTEKEHKRRMELFAKMIENERPMQPVTSKTQSSQVRSG
jgi:hypothetical protein